MHRKHFGFTHFPFDLELQPEDLFASNAITEAEARLKHLLELRAIGLVTGEVGSGKTTVCRKVASTLHPGSTASSTCPCPPAMSWMCTNPLS